MRPIILVTKRKYFLQSWCSASILYKYTPVMKSCFPSTVQSQIFDHTSFTNGSQPLRCRRCNRREFLSRCASAYAICTTAFAPKSRTSTGFVILFVGRACAIRVKWAQTRCAPISLTLPASELSPRPRTVLRYRQSCSCIKTCSMSNCRGWMVWRVLRFPGACRWCSRARKWRAYLRCSRAFTRCWRGCCMARACASPKRCASG